MGLLFFYVNVNGIRKWSVAGMLALWGYYNRFQIGCFMLFGPGEYFT